MKTYSSKSNANRAAKSLEAGSFTIEPVGKLFAIVPNYLKHYFDVCGEVNCPACNIALDNGMATDTELKDSGMDRNEKFEYICLGCGHEWGPAIQTKKAKAPKVDKPKQETNGDPELRGSSTVTRPTKAVWDIAEKMKKANPDARRKDILEACQKAGIAYYTARTQYQLWFQATKASQK